MVKIREAIVVEGRYDKNTLSQIVDAPILETSGFGIFKNKEQMALLRSVAEKRGLIVFTDADGAGFVIRNHIKSAIPNRYLKHAYTPDILGKELRKREPGKEGKLGVEGMKRDVILEALRRAGATFEGEASPETAKVITKADLMDLGLYGPGSNDRRAALIRHLRFPEKISTNGFLQAVNLLYSLEELNEIIAALEKKMVDIQVKNLTKFFVIGENLLEGLSFEIQEGERVAILGRNGCGKTTLFKILTGEMDFDDGEVYVNPNKKLGLISQIPKFPEGFTVEDVLRSAYTAVLAAKRKMEILEAAMSGGASDEQLREYDDLTNRFLSGGGYDMDVEVDKICNGLGITADQRIQEFDSLSGGERTRVNLARLLLEKTEILLLDEPTNHLDLSSVEWLEGYIKSFKGTVLTISHDRYFLDRVAQRVIEIVDGHAEFYSGNYSFYMDEKQARFDLQLKQYQQEQAKLKQLGYTVERMKGWGINNRTLYRRAMSIQHRMERIKKTERPKTEKTMKATFGERDFSGDVVFNLKNMAKAFGDRTLFSDVNLKVEGGERIAILGDNGTGKSTFIKCLLGEEDCAGKIQFGPTVKWGYLPQIIHFDHPERTLYDTMLYEKNCTPQVARDRLGQFLFSGEDVFKTVGTLSGGEQSRLRLCMLMDEKINLLILDEPTNHLDIASREWVEAAIEEFEGVLLFVSHDRYFIEKFAERIWLLEDGQIRDFKCGYQKYRSILEHEAMAKPVVTAAPKPKKEKPKGGTKEQDKLIRRLEREIEKQEKLLAEFDPKIEAASADYQELTRLLEEKEEAEMVLLELMEAWEAAQE